MANSPTGFDASTIGIEWAKRNAARRASPGIIELRQQVAQTDPEMDMTNVYRVVSRQPIGD